MIMNIQKKEHNKSMRPKNNNNIHTVTSNNDGIVASNKIHR